MMSSGERVQQGLNYQFCVAWYARYHDIRTVPWSKTWNQKQHLMISPLHMIWRRADDDKQWYMYLVTREIRRYWQVWTFFLLQYFQEARGGSGVSQTLKNTGNLCSTAITFQFYFVFALNPCQVSPGRFLTLGNLLINMMVFFDVVQSFWNEVEKYSRRSITLKP